jgi:tetratricopeptide (TPR) repeat protein
VVAVTGGIEKTNAGQVSPQVEVDALCRGAAVLSREDNRIAARALLWAAVAIDPQNFVAHRRLAAALLNSDDTNAAAEEYARYIELLLKEDDVRRAAAELAYAQAFLGDVPQLSSAAAHLVPLGAIAKALETMGAAQSSPPLALADYAASRAPYRDLNNWGRAEQPTVTKTTTPQGRRRHRRRWYQRLASEIGVREYVLVVSLVTAAAIAVFAMGGLR